jgi:hypothetical protein
MMLDINTESARQGSSVICLSVCWSPPMLFEMLADRHEQMSDVSAPADPGGASNTAWLGNVVRNYLPFGSLR